MSSAFPDGLPNPAYWHTQRWASRMTEPITLYTEDMQGPNRQTWHSRAFTTPHDLRQPECGQVTVRIDTIPPDPDKVYALTICAADYSEPWMQAFNATFSRYRSLRAAYRVQPTAPPVPHAKTTITIADQHVPVDVLIAPAVAALNAQGVHTVASCQGDNASRQRPGFITLAQGQTFPDALAAVWQHAGWSVTSEAGHDTVRVQAPYGLWEQAHAQWRLSLTDWMMNRLDVSGARYQLSESRPNSLPVLSRPDWPLSPGSLRSSADPLVQAANVSSDPLQTVWRIVPQTLGHTTRWMALRFTPEQEAWRVQTLREPHYTQRGWMTDNPDTLRHVVHLLGVTDEVQIAARFPLILQSQTPGVSPLDPAASKSGRPGPRP